MTTKIKYTYDNVEVLLKLFPYMKPRDVVWLEFMAADCGTIHHINLRGYSNSSITDYSMETVNITDELMSLIYQQIRQEKLDTLL